MLWEPALAQLLLHHCLIMLQSPPANFSLFLNWTFSCTWTKQLLRALWPLGGPTKRWHGWGKHWLTGCDQHRNPASVSNGVTYFWLKLATRPDTCCWADPCHRSLNTEKMKFHFADCTVTQWVTSTDRYDRNDWQLPIISVREDVNGKTLLCIKNKWS